MRSTLAGLRTLVLPFGALPGSPQLDLGFDPPPAELVAYYGSYNIINGILWRQDATTYNYDILLQHKILLTATQARGVVAAGVVHELEEMSPAGAIAAQLVYGNIEAAVIEYRANTSVSWLGANSIALFGSGSFLTLQSGSQISASGLFLIDGISAPRTFLAAVNRAANGVAVTTPAGGAETAVPSANWDSEPTHSLRNTGLWLGRATGFYTESSGVGGIATVIRIRKGAASVAGTQLALMEYPSPVGFGGFTLGFEFFFLLKNTSGSTVSTKLSMTVAGTGAGTNSLYGDAPNRQLAINLREIGDTGDHSSLATLAASV